MPDMMPDYLRSVPPGGALESTAGGLRSAAGAAAMGVAYGSGAEMEGLGRSVSGLGKVLKKRELEEAQTQYDTAVLKYGDEIHGYLDQFERESHIDENGIPQWGKSFEELKSLREGAAKKYEASLHPLVRQDFRKMVAARDEDSDRVLEGKIKGVKDTFVKTVGPQQVERLYRQGRNAEAVTYWARLTRENPDLFTPDEQIRHEDEFEVASIYGAMQYDPDSVPGMIDSATLTEEVKTNLRSHWKSVQTAITAQAEKIQQRQRNAREADLTGRALQAESEGNTTELLRLTGQLPNMITKGEIDRDFGTSLYDRLTKQKTVVNPQSAVAMELILDRVGTGEMTLAEGVRSFGRINGDMTEEQRNKYYTELTGKQSAWRTGLRSKGRAVIEAITGQVPVRFDEKGKIVVPKPEETAASQQANVIASQAAQMRFYQILREAEANRETLAEDRFIPLAIAVGRQVQEERTKYGIEFVKDRYLTPAAGPNEEIDRHVTYSDLRTGQEYVNGKTKQAQEPEPQTVSDMQAGIRRILASSGRDAAKVYYERWIGKFE